MVELTDEQKAVAEMRRQIADALKSYIGSNAGPVTTDAAKALIRRVLDNVDLPASIEHVEVETSLDPDDRTRMHVRLTALTPLGEAIIRRVERMQQGDT
jgi:hypothetical protein